MPRLDNYKDKPFHERTNEQANNIRAKENKASFQAAETCQVWTSSLSFSFNPNTFLCSKN